MPFVDLEEKKITLKFVCLEEKKKTTVNAVRTSQKLASFIGIFFR